MKAAIWHERLMKLKKNKLFFYVKSYFTSFLPHGIYSKNISTLISPIKKEDKIYITERVNYYNQLTKQANLPLQAITVKDLRHFKKLKTYFFDTYSIAKHFAKNKKLLCLFGDINYVADNPTIQKSRPIIENNANAVLLKLNKIRHFLFIKDPIPYESKKNMLVGRFYVDQPQRISFLETHFENPFCNVGQINTNGGNIRWLKPKISIYEHLQYKFIISIEGNDVASNLKWIMSSHSIAVMPKPKYETWFMEGRLKPNVHYILIKDDYSDLDEKINYYLQNPLAAKTIIENAQSYISQFKNKRREKAISLLVLEKYFYYTGQLQSYTEL